MSKQAIIIDTGIPHRSLDTRKSHPRGLDQVYHHQGTLLDWAIAALDHWNIETITYMGSYHIEKVIKQYPNLHYHYYECHEEDDHCVALELLKCENLEQLIILPSHFIYLPNAFADMKEYTIAISKSESYLGPIFLKGQGLIDYRKATSLLSEKKQSINHANLIHTLNAQGFSFTYLDLSENIAPCFDQMSVRKILFQGKGKTLEHFAPILKEAIILDQFRFSVREWKANKDAILKTAQSIYPNDNLIVRSCTKSEDSLISSQAGAYQTVLDVKSDNTVSLISACNLVLESYTKLERAPNEQDEILIQKQIGNLKYCGVLLTRCPNTGSPYFVISVDEESGRSDSVTSGNLSTIKNIYISRATIQDHIPKEYQNLIRTANELISISFLDALDIEFGIDHSNQLYIFQIRPLLVKDYILFSDEEITHTLEEAFQFTSEKFKPTWKLYGQSTLLGVMPDWNPAEMIGIAPNPLALSLYQYLITNKTWAAARARLGYQDVNHPLIYAICGKPYVDVRASLNSLLPADLNPEVARIWTDYCLNNLKDNPCLHDKIEFEIAISCLSPDWAMRKEALQHAGLGSEEINHFYNSVKNLTNSVLINNSEISFQQLERLKTLTQNRNTLFEEESTSIYQSLKRLSLLMEDTIANGIYPFAILARLAFISLSFLQGLKKINAISDETFNSVLQSIPTVSKDFTQQVQHYSESKVSLDSLVEKFGHLRPNSYDINSPNYASAPDLFFNAPLAAPSKYEHSDNSLNLPQSSVETINCILADCNFNLNAAQLISCIQKSIQNRELAKFEFMKNVNAILCEIEKIGVYLNLKQDDLAYLNIQDLLSLTLDSTCYGKANHLRKFVAFNRKKYQLDTLINLPYLISAPKEIYAFQVSELAPNFITQRQVVAQPVFLNCHLSTGNLAGRIVLITSADPGYDWIFGQGIAGLITAFGGVASHMAIRCAEYNLPAAIGCGTEMLDKIKSCEKINLDCLNKRIQIIS